MYGIITAVALVLAAATSEAGLLKTKEICCDKIGCFKDDGIFSHMPLPKCPEDFGVSYSLYTRGNDLGPETLEFGKKPKYFNPDHITIFSSHGWMGDGELWWLIEAKKTILEMMPANIIITDWKEGSEKIYYPTSASTTRTVGAHLAYLIDDLVATTGASYDNMWCIGFSLGAHVCGHAGMRTKQQIARVTGLDPAGPWFRDEDPKAGLNKESGKFVDVIHSDGDGIAAYYGIIANRGHVDFYPNGGKSQPGCWTKKRSLPNGEEEYYDVLPYGESLGCSHYRSVRFFLETLTDDDCHVARMECTDYKKMPKNCHEIDDEVRMGFKAHLNERKTGMYYLTTGKKSPYCHR